MVVYGESERPRVVAVGFDRTHPFAAVVEQYAPTVHYLTENPDIRWQSWDAVVSLGRPTMHEPHLRVLQIGGEPCGSVRSGNFSYQPALYLSEHIGHELVVPDDLPDDLAELVKRQLKPVVDAQVHRLRIAPYRLASGGSGDDYRPLLHDLDRYALAAVYKPHTGVHECLYLPEMVTDLAPWLIWAFKRWSEELPDVFPSQPDWTSDPTWMTADELSAKAAAVEKRAEADNVIADAEAAVEEAEAAFSKLRESADGSERLLLTSTDTPLVDAVHETLELFGFGVTDVDAGLEEGQHKKEDLRVSETADWTALSEVKGYTKGGKLADLRKLDDYATLYAAEAGKPPDGKWYVVNQFRGTDPNSRPQLLAGADEYLNSFGSEGGAAIDTRDLFRLRKAVEAGTVSKAYVRELLMKARGRFELPDGFGESSPP